MFAFFNDSFRKRRIGLQILILLVVGCASSRLSGEETELQWTQTAADCNPQIKTHLRTKGFGGDGIERISVVAGIGTYCYASHPIGSACIIEDFVASVDIRSNREGLQLLARVVFPRTADSNLEPLSVVVRGDVYRGHGSWQQLRIDNLPMKVQRAKRQLRLRHSSKLDLSESYIDQLMINIYGGPGVTTTEIGKIDKRGVVSVKSVQQISKANSDNSVRQPTVPVTLQDGIIRVGGTPFFPRVIEHRGESLEFLANLGFNTIALSEAPVKHLLDDAERLGLWLVPIDPLPSFRNARNRRVLAFRWTEGNDPEENTVQVSPALDIVDSMKQFPSRPIRLIGIDESRKVNSTSQYFSKLAQVRRDLSRNSAGFWAYVSTDTTLGQNSEEISADLSLATRIREQSLAAIATGVRGIWFASSRSLDSNDRLTALRRLALERLNIEQQILQPWLLAGRPDQVSIDSGRLPSTINLSLERARLLVRIQPERSMNISRAPHRKPTIRLAGLSNIRQCYELSTSGLTPIKKVRVAGGVVVHPSSYQSHVVSTSDPMVVKQVKRRIASFGERPTRIELQLARIELELVRLLVDGFNANRADTQKYLDSAEESFSKAAAQLQVKNYRTAHKHLQSARQQLSELQQLVNRAENVKHEDCVKRNENQRSI